MAVTTIQVQTETRNLLKNIGDKGKTYDDIIRELASIREAYIQLMLDRLEECSPETTRPIEEVLDEIDKTPIVRKKRQRR